MRHWPCELAHHHELGGVLLESWEVDVCCPTVFDIHVCSNGGINAQVAVEKFTFVPARVMSKRFVADGDGEECTRR